MRNMSLFIASFLKSRGRAFDRGIPQVRVSLVLEFITRSHELTCLVVPPRGFAE